MSGKVLQINFKIGVPPAQYEELASSLADGFAKVPGLVWKIWIMDKANLEAGGIYYFDSDDTLQKYLSSQLARDVQAHPALSEISAKTFDVMESVSATTRGPVFETALR